MPTGSQPRSTPLTMAIVEDDARVRRSLLAMLHGVPGSECVGDYATGEEAVAGLARQPARVVVVDINLPGMNGVECARQLRQILPDAQLIMLTVHEDTDTIFKALQAGANGYLLKPVRAQELIAAVQDVVAGGAPMTGSIARKVVQAFQRKPAQGTEALSPRETEVLECLAKGQSYKEIADHLNVSYSTVHTHIERIFRKLQVNSRAQAVARQVGRI